MKMSSLNFKGKFPVKILIEALKKNKVLHEKEYAESIEVYYKKMETALLNLHEVSFGLASSAREKKDLTYYNDLQIALRAVSSLVKPVDCKKLYDEYIKMFKDMAEPNVELTVQEYNSIVNDEWDWAINAKTVNSTYLSAGASR